MDAGRDRRQGLLGAEHSIPPGTATASARSTASAASPAPSIPSSSQVPMPMTGTCVFSASAISDNWHLTSHGLGPSANDDVHELVRDHDHLRDLVAVQMGPDSPGLEAELLEFLA